MTKTRAEKTAISNTKQKPEAAEVAGPNGSRPPGVEVLFARTHAAACSWRGTAGLYLINDRLQFLYSATGSPACSKYKHHP